MIWVGTGFGREDPVPVPVQVQMQVPVQVPVQVQMGRSPTSPERPFRRCTRPPRRAAPPPPIAAGPRLWVRRLRSAGPPSPSPPPPHPPVPPSPGPGAATRGTCRAALRELIRAQSDGGDFLFSFSLCPGYYEKRRKKTGCQIIIMDS